MLNGVSRWESLHITFETGVQKTIKKKKKKKKTFPYRALQSGADGAFLLAMISLFEVNRAKR